MIAESLNRLASDSGPQDEMAMEKEMYNTESMCFPTSLLLTNHPMVSCR